MKKHPPYLIHHVYLDKQVTPPELDLTENGLYLVFWWKDIALGHLFLEPGNSLAAHDYNEKLLQAIRPAIEFYAREQQHMRNDWQTWLINKDLDKWAHWMRRVFSANLQKEIPGRVPVSVIICTRNRTPALLRCLQMISSLTCQPAEIIVVDNCPSDASTQEVTTQFPNVSYVREPRLGLDIARNTGIANAGSPIVAFVDDDVVIHPLWVYRVWETFQDPFVTAMTGLIIALELKTEAQYIFEKYWSFNRGYIDKTYDSGYFNSMLPKGPPVWKIGAGANMAFRKDVFREVGYFDELLDAGAAGCNGDSEMWYRILAKGHTIKYNPRAIVYHQHRKDHKGFRKQIFYYMRGFVTAALIQQRQNQQAGYKRFIVKLLPLRFLRFLVRGFPNYPLRYSTLGAEVRGTLSGLIYFLKNRRPHSKTGV
ncbi:GT2 family glycosyltransferase [Pontibacter ummariensis]|uniref:Glycosyltransferase, GT2 family n=1 Tax=Pontibacter ummariensis TaxID=1610492 RepID=A0A239K4M2_9BACT|nr:glycosyltransferase [Pontibacter ummariensis]PRY06783.1 GT2 family glycosyltransferase [Pontibacter ummariensis]SNT12738.1 Glycosyltransferase, GT2 family [Pontibacter ummariensis]